MSGNQLKTPLIGTTHKNYQSTDNQAVNTASPKDSKAGSSNDNRTICALATACALSLLIGSSIGKSPAQKCGLFFLFGAISTSLIFFKKPVQQALSRLKFWSSSENADSSSENGLELSSV